MARQALHAKLPEGWEEAADPATGEPFYHHAASGISNYAHPSDAKFRRRVDEARRRLQQSPAFAQAEAHGGAHGKAQGEPQDEPQGGAEAEVDGEADGGAQGGAQGEVHGEVHGATQGATQDATQGATPGAPPLAGVELTRARQQQLQWAAYAS